MKEWYIVARDSNGDQLAYIAEGNTPEEARVDFEDLYPELTFINMF